MANINRVEGDKKEQKQHRHRKNPGSAEREQERRQEKNAARPKQKWVDGAWVRV